LPGEQARAEADAQFVGSQADAQPTHDQRDRAEQHQHDGYPGPLLGGRLTPDHSGTQQAQERGISPHEIVTLLGVGHGDSTSGTPSALFR